MRPALARTSGAALCCLYFLSGNRALAQQFNSDSWISKPLGTVTAILTTGERTTMFMETFSLFRNWEFTAAQYVYNKDSDRKTSEGTQGSLYAKYMFYENREKTGGFSVKAGAGMRPSYQLDGSGYQTPKTTLWMNAPATIPFFDNKLSWDIMPGWSATLDSEGKGNTAWAFTYSTRLAWNPVGPQWAIVGEVYGAVGEAKLDPEFRIGLRYEPNVHVNIAFTYDQMFNGSPGAGWEIGVMLFSPPFLCFSGCP
ncbi:MAG TPA: hypothetical protein VL084_00220 [Thermoanaerobaculia bacterium]|nr:hypothetical protein [Thermoanaerobaculia bacterium]